MTKNVYIIEKVAGFEIRDNGKVVATKENRWEAYKVAREIANGKRIVVKNI